VCTSVVCVYICGVSVFIGIIFELMLIKTHTYTPNRYYNIWVGIVSGLNNMFKTGKKENKEKKRKSIGVKNEFGSMSFQFTP